MTVDVTVPATRSNPLPELDQPAAGEWLSAERGELVSVEGAGVDAPATTNYAVSPINGHAIPANADTAARARAAKRAKRQAEAEAAVATVGGWQAVVEAVAQKAVDKGSPAAMSVVGKAIDAFPREDRERHSSGAPVAVVVQVQQTVNARVLELVGQASRGSEREDYGE